MSVEKAQIKMATAHEMGVRIDDALESADHDALRMEGGMEWLARAMPLVAAAHKRVDEDTDSGKHDLETAKLLKAVIDRMAADLSKLGTQASQELHVQRGKAVGLRLAVTLAKQLFDSEQGKVAAILRAAVEEAPAPAQEPPQSPAVSDPADDPAAPRTRPTGRRPGASLKAKRERPGA
jgi:hypothetical protein